jgi:hypothetical protein
MIDVLEHLTRPEALDLLRLAAGRLTPGGYVLLSVPNAACPEFGLRRYGDITHEMAYTPGSVSQLMRLAGLGDVRVHELRPRVHGPLGLVRRLLWSFFRSVARLRLAVSTGRLTHRVLSMNLVVVARRTARGGSGG